MHSFWRLRQVLLTRVSPVLREAHDLEIPDVFLLTYIGNSDLSPSEIAEHMRLPAHAISRKLDPLEKRGFIRRSLDPEDARRRVLTLTPEGEALLKAAAVTLEGEVAALLSVLPRETLVVMLSAMEDVTYRSADPAPQAAYSQETL